MSAPPPRKDRTADPLPDLATVAEPCILRRNGLTPTGARIAMRKFAGKPSPLIVYEAEHNPTHEECLAATGGREYCKKGHTTCRYDLGQGFDRWPTAVQVKLQRLRFWDEEKGKYRTATCRPRGFDHEIKASHQAIAAVVSDYCPRKLAEIEQRTGIRYKKLREIGGRGTAAAEAAIRAGTLWNHAVDETHMKAGSRQKLPHLTHVARDTKLGTVYLQVLGPWKEAPPDDADDHDHKGKKTRRVPATQEDRAESLASMLAQTQPAGSRLRVALDGDRGLNGLVDMALQKARQLRPDLPPGQRVLDRWHVTLNLRKPLEKMIAELRRSLPEGDESDALRYMISACENYLLKASWHTIAEKESALWGLSAIFERRPELEEPFWTRVLFSEVLAAPDGATARQRYGDWLAGLSEDMRELFSGFLAYLKERHDAFFAYFDAKDDTRAVCGTAVSITSSPCESYNRLVKRCTRDAPAASLDLLHEKMTLGYGVPAKEEEAELTRLWELDWKHRQRQGEVKKKRQAAKRGHATATPAVAAQATLSLSDVGPI